MNPHYLLAIQVRVVEFRISHNIIHRSTTFVAARFFWITRYCEIRIEVGDLLSIDGVRKEKRLSLIFLYFMNGIIPTNNDNGEFFKPRNKFHHFLCCKIPRKPTFHGNCNKLFTLCSPPRPLCPLSRT